jgi:hypothetical protein
MNTEYMGRKHSGLGIASLSISIIVIIVIILGFLLNIKEGVEDVWFCGTLIISLVALGLGIGGLIQKDQKKLFAILGTIFSAAIIICFVGGAIVLAVMYLQSL